jgi:hypothetical protein
MKNGFAKWVQKEGPIAKWAKTVGPGVRWARKK